ncbi:MAG: hypothetical protein H0X27_02725 [Caulobacteraceae bacterium]|nr:hypothetical protein [Caulobacteraceae bacterium]
MRDIIDVRGASGAVYRFNLLREGRPLSPMGGNFLYAREAGERYEVVHVGECQNLLTGARALWNEAVRDHGATHLFTRLNITERVRAQEHADIVEAVRPPMNPASAEAGAA